MLPAAVVGTFTAPLLGAVSLRWCSWSELIVTMLLTAVVGALHATVRWTHRGGAAPLIGAVAVVWFCCRLHLGCQASC